MGKTNTKNRHEKGWLGVCIIIIAWLLIGSLSKDIWRIRIGFNRITEANKRLEAEKVKNAALKVKLELVMTEDYKEKIIREKLNMQKEGEVLAVMPEKELRQAAEEKVLFVPIWKKWWNLISM